VACTLTSWKEIGQHLGKGVRTVQRWERQLGLPVRRPHGRSKGTVLALTDELDAWVRSQFSSEDSGLKTVVRELEEVKKQNEVLRLAAVSRHAIPPTGFADTGADIDDSVLQRCTLAIARNSAIRLEVADIIKVSQRDRALRETLRRQKQSAAQDPPKQ
jgi:hypothetical protein